jgi:Ni/Co efflux regulator RcnB
LNLRFWFFFHERTVMIEKQETEEFDDTDDEDTLDGDSAEEDVDLVRLARDMDVARRRGARQGVPAWRKLELLAEQRRTAELTSDFDDYDLDEPKRGGASRARVGLSAR